MYIGRKYENFVSTQECTKTTGLDKYEIALLVAQRARELYSGATPEVSSNCKKEINIALNEIASGKLDVEALNERLITNLLEPKAVGKAYKQPEMPELETIVENLVEMDRKNFSYGGQEEGSKN